MNNASKSLLVNESDSVALVSEGVCDEKGEDGDDGGDAQHNWNVKDPKDLRMLSLCRDTIYTMGARKVRQGKAVIGFIVQVF